MPADLDKPLTVRYEGQVYRLAETGEFVRWIEALRDQRATTRIVDRLKRASKGNFGDAKSVGNGVSELRIDYGPGYRIYFCRRGRELVILLCGGDKSSQQVDIAKAKRIKAELERDNGDQTI